MTDTPRTDNVCEHNYTDAIIRFARELEREVVQITKERDEIKKTLADLMPYVLDDYYPRYATPGFKAAVESAVKASGVDAEGKVSDES